MPPDITNCRAPRAGGAGAGLDNIPRVGAAMSAFLTPLKYKRVTRDIAKLSSLPQRRESRQPQSSVNVASGWCGTRSSQSLADARVQRAAKLVSIGSTKINAYPLA